MVSEEVSSGLCVGGLNVLRGNLGPRPLRDIGRGGEGTFNAVHLGEQTPGGKPTTAVAGVRLRGGWGGGGHPHSPRHPLLPKEVTSALFCWASVLANPAFCCNLSPSALPSHGSLMRRGLGAPALGVVLRMSNKVPSL